MSEPLSDARDAAPVTPAGPPARTTADPLAIGPFRTRLVRSVVLTVVVLTMTATALSVRLTETISREREAAILAAHIGEPGAGRSGTAADLAALEGRSVRVFSREVPDGATRHWGFYDTPQEGAWAAATSPDGTTRIVETSRPGVTAAMRETTLLRLGIGGGILAWLTFWAGLLVTQRTTRRLQDSADQLVHAWTHDGQTGLMNHDSLLAAIDGSRSSARGALLFIWVDDLSEHHDTLGPEHAEALLGTIVQRTRDRLPDGAVLGRYTTDCIAAWVPGFSEAEGTATATAIRAALHAPVETTAAVVLPTPRIGIALRPRDGDTGQSLIAHAGRASRSGIARANGVAVYQKRMDADRERHLWMRPLLQEAIVAGSIHLHYQPKLDATTGKIGSVEALARWTVPGRGSIRPDHFIAVAEQSGQIHQLTRSLLDKALDQAQRLHDQGHSCPIALNLSGLSMEDGDLVSDIQAGLGARALPSSALEVEVTETAAMADSRLALQRLGELRSLRIHIAMDDFGTGESSLAQLGRMPVDEVKIDQAFIRPLDAGDPSEDPAWLLVEGIIRLATTLGCSVTAEGVEHAAIGTRLAGLGCSTLQGWAYSKAVPGPELEAMLDKQRDG